AGCADGADAVAVSIDSLSLSEGHQQAQAECSPERMTALKFLTDCLGRLLRCTMIDGRVLVGTFACTDRDSNIILAGCLEYQSLADCLADPRDCRSLGLAMIPGNKLVKMELESFGQQQNDVSDGLRSDGSPETPAS
ncbi:hypothetical protein BOX15_Mlig029748g2, partial [Macrostomum lignano]